MKKNFLTILISSLFLSSFGQLDADCFKEVKKQYFEETERLALGKKFVPDLDTANKNLTEADWDSILAIKNRALKRLTNCRFPTSYLRTSENKEINTSKIKSDFTLVNFNYFYCDACIQQLEDYAQIKKEMKDKVTILIFFPEDLKDIQSIVNKYKSLFEFIPGMRKYIDENNLGLGTPFNLVLEKHKNVKYATNGANNKSGLLYKELIPYLK
jgi:hypothetical protein